MWPSMPSAGGRKPVVGSPLCPRHRARTSSSQDPALQQLHSDLRARMGLTPCLLDDDSKAQSNRVSTLSHPSRKWRSRAGPGPPDPFPLCHHKDVHLGAPRHLLTPRSDIQCSSESPKEPPQSCSAKKHRQAVLGGPLGEHLTGSRQGQGPSHESPEMSPHSQ